MDSKITKKNEFYKERKSFKQKINLKYITKKYWKEQLILYFLGTLSFLFAFVIKKNALGAIFKIAEKIVKGKEVKKDEMTFTLFF